MVPLMPHTAIYARVSTDEQAKEGYSIDAQVNILRAYVTIKGLDEPVLYIDDGYSAKNLNRPQIQKLLADCKNGGVGSLLVWRLDRFSRSLRDTIEIVEDILKPRKIDFLSSTESIDTSTPSGRLMLNILASFAQNEREATSERVKMVSADLARHCRHMGGVPPFGYKVVDGFYKVDEEKADAVRTLFRMFIERQGYGDMLKYLNENGFRTATGKEFSKNSLFDLLGNEKYSGLYVYITSAGN